MKARKLLTTFALALPLFLILLLAGSILVYNLRKEKVVIIEPTELDLVQQELAAKNYNLAEERLKTILNKNPQQVDAVLRLNEIYLLRGKTQAQQELLEQYKNSSDGAIQNALADYYYAKQEFDTALAHSKSILESDLDNKPAIIRILKIYSLTDDKEAALDFLQFINLSGLDAETMFLVNIAQMNFKENRLESMQNIYSQVPENHKKIIDTYIANYPLLNEPDKELSSRANIVYSLLNEQLYELALPFSQEMASLNKYYENSLLYRAIINVHSKNFELALTDLELLEKYYPGKNSTKVLMLECRLHQADQEKVAGIVSDLAKNFVVEDNKKYVEAFKLLYAYKDYAHLRELFLTVGAYIEIDRNEIDYLALKSMIFLNDVSALQGIITKLNQNYFALNSEQQAELRASEAFLAFQTEQDVAKAEILINEAYTLNNTAYFVYYINTKWNPALFIIDRTKELDLHNEIPS